MIPKEHFFTEASYEYAGIEPFLEHIRDYRTGQKTIPVSKTMRGINGHETLFTFSDCLLETFLEDTPKIKKSYEVALKYGFMGYSRGGRNGIFYIRKRDQGLLRAIPQLIEIHREMIQQDLDIPKKGLDVLKRVKIVHHNPSGKRIVGMYDQPKNRIFFMDFAQY